MKLAYQTRVAFVNHTGAVSGAERVLLNMAKGLDRSTYEVIAICPESGGLSAMLRDEGVTCVPMPPVEARFSWRLDLLWKAFTSLTRAIFSLRRTLARVDPDIVHANTLRAGVAVSVACIGTGRKVVWHIHDDLPHHAFSMAIRATALLLRPTRVVAVSDSTATAFRGPFSFRGRVVTLHNGVDLSRFPPKSGNSYALRRSLGIPEDAFLICSIGQICARKGLIELVTAFERVCEQSPRMHLVIAGEVVFEHERSYFNMLRMTASASQSAVRIHFTGQVGNVSDLMQASDLLVLNSREEPFGLVLVEAMSSGTPVLATRVGGVPEIVKDRETGWLVEKADTTGLAAKMLELSENKSLLEQAARRAQMITCPQFSLEKFQSRLHRFYAELLPSPRQFVGRAESISHSQS